MKMEKLHQMELAFLFLVYLDGFQIPFYCIYHWAMVKGTIYRALNIWCNIWKLFIKNFH